MRLAEEWENLTKLVSSGQDKARKLTRARILLKADAGHDDKAVSRPLDVSRPSGTRCKV